MVVVITVTVDTDFLTQMSETYIVENRKEVVVCTIIRIPTQEVSYPPNRVVVYGTGIIVITVTTIIV